MNFVNEPKVKNITRRRLAEIGELGHYGILVFGHCLRYINKRNLNYNLLRHFQVVNPHERIPGKCYEQPSVRLQSAAPIE